MRHAGHTCVLFCELLVEIVVGGLLFDRVQPLCVSWLTNLDDVQFALPPHASTCALTPPNLPIPMQHCPGVRALMAAAVHGRLADVSALLSLGADPTATLPNGQSAADLAAMRGHSEVVELLQACATEAAKLQETEAATAALSHYQQHAQADEVGIRLPWFMDLIVFVCHMCVLLLSLLHFDIRVGRHFVALSQLSVVINLYVHVLSYRPVL